MTQRCTTPAELSWRSTRLPAGFIMPGTYKFWQAHRMQAMVGSQSITGFPGDFPAGIIIDPPQAQPVPQRNWNHHRHPAPVINQEYLSNPVLACEKYRPWNAVDGKQQAGPDQQQCGFSRVNARECEKNPYRHFVSFIHIYYVS
jgi:hypothetical protein